MTKLKENDHQREEDLKMQVRNKMYSLTRSSVQLRRDMEKKILEEMVEH